ncbi:PTS system mannose/fructose/sorbose family transporter subunit IID [Vulgatibacter incomptus]|uniref:PTS system, mannose-specific IID component n=1 Tax=Vulgatibacter incomptus TaxID=1391653 RepID=A0A0K1PFE0_9BACT|nr:PTS system mannose/fructose/sorbose family transporter subunit IID [Vulgatibacter incomptus]AKU92225.1 PTS system, mannose-specific IID component [Vulgatibacter incomptus]
MSLIAHRSHAGLAARSALPGRIRLRVFLRSLLLQASWNPRGMQSLGMAHALWPALAWLHPEGEARTEAVKRHVAFFNTHPYLSAAILGGVLRHEERIARGEEPVEELERFRQALMFPLAAVGDSFFWLSLRPLAGLVAALSSPWTGLWAVAIFLGLYDLPHFALRVRLFVEGYRREGEVVEVLRRIGLLRWGARLRVAVAVLGGVAAAFVPIAFATGHHGAGNASFALLLGASIVAWAAAWWLLARRGSVAAGWIAVAVGIVLALVWA